MSSQQSRGWHPEDIKAAIRKKGTTLSALATNNGLSDSACRAALIRSVPEAERVISTFLNVPLHVLWPARHERPASGTTRHERDENIHNRGRAQRQIAGAD